MKPLKFNPKVFRINTKGMNGNSVWDLLTVDGENPNETVYFMLDGDSPSFNDSDKINKAIENKEWTVHTIEELDLNINDFSINKSIFDFAGEGYAEIRGKLNLFR